MTNYEKIKNMSVQEMADMLDDIDDISAQPCDPRYCEGYGDGIHCSHENREKHCRQAIVNWLNSEVVNQTEQEREGEMKISETEAINAIKCNRPTSGYIILCEALDMAVDALEKQIPKRPLTKSLANDGYAWEWTCPNCRIVKVTTEKQFCNDCGQRLDWSNHPTEKGGAKE